jgi:rubrerythrin
MNREQLRELVCQALETEQGGIEIYEKAVECAQNADLKKEWQKYLEETESHVEVLLTVCTALEIDPEGETPGRSVVRHIGSSLVKAMEMAQKAGSPEAAELVAAECVVLAETKDHMNWELIGKAAEDADGEVGDALLAAFDEVETEEDEHLYHTTGWARELWIQSLGMAAVIPPPEEERHVKTAIGAARAKNAREEML